MRELMIGPCPMNITHLFILEKEVGLVSLAQRSLFDNYKKSNIEEAFSPDM